MKRTLPNTASYTKWYEAEANRSVRPRTKRLSYHKLHVLKLKALKSFNSQAANLASIKKGA